MMHQLHQTFLLDLVLKAFCLLQVDVYRPIMNLLDVHPGDCYDVKWTEQFLNFLGLKVQDHQEEEEAFCCKLLAMFYMRIKRSKAMLYFQYLYNLVRGVLCLLSSVFEIPRCWSATKGFWIPIAEWIANGMNAVPISKMLL